MSCSASKSSASEAAQWRSRAARISRSSISNLLDRRPPMLSALYHAQPGVPHFPDGAGELCPARRLSGRLPSTLDMLPDDRLRREVAVGEATLNLRASRLALHRARGQPGDVVLDKERIDDRHWDRAQERRRHQLAPIEYVALDQLGDDPDRHGAHRALAAADEAGGGL